MTENDSTTDGKALATRFLEAWTSGDFDTAATMLAPDVEFVGALGQTRGAEAYIEGVRGFVKLLKGVNIKYAFGDGEDVCVVYDLVTQEAGDIPTAGIYKIRDGKVASVRAFFDPRPLLPN